MDRTPADDDLPHELRVADQAYVVSRAVAADVAAVVALLHDDLGAARESVTTEDLSAYRRAFEEIDADPHQLLVVVRRHDEVVATLQLTFLRTLSRRLGWVHTQPRPEARPHPSRPVGVS